MTDEPEQQHPADAGDGPVDAAEAAEAAERNPVDDLPDELVEGIGAALERLAERGSVATAVIRHNHPHLEGHEVLNGLRVEHDPDMKSGLWFAMTAEEADSDDFLRLRGKYDPARRWSPARSDDSRTADELNARGAEGHRPIRPFSELRDSGLLWLINAAVFHPRGFALSLYREPGSQEPAGWRLLGDGTEPWVSDERGLDDLFARAERTLNDARPTRFTAKLVEALGPEAAR